MLMKTAIMYLACFLMKLNGRDFKDCVLRGVSFSNFKIWRLRVAFLRACAQSFAGLWACFKIFKICVSQFRGRGGAQFASRLGRVF